MKLGSASKINFTSIRVINGSEQELKEVENHFLNQSIEGKANEVPSLAAVKKVFDLTVVKKQASNGSKSYLFATDCEAEIIDTTLFELESVIARLTSLLKSSLENNLLIDFYVRREKNIKANLNGNFVKGQSSALEAKDVLSAIKSGTFDFRKLRIRGLVLKP